LGGAGGYNQAAAELVEAALFDEMVRLIQEPEE